jgi:hypothetical protein
VDTLTNVQDAMGESIEEGGLTENEIAVIMPAVEGILTRLSFDVKKNKIFPSMESFSNKETRAHATKVAMEEIGEAVSKVLSAIKAGFQKAIDWVKSFLSSMFSASKKLGERAAALLKSALYVKGSKTEQVKVDLPNGAGGTYAHEITEVTHFERFLLVHGAIVAKDAIVASYSKTVEYCGKVIDDVTEAVSKSVDAGKELANNTADKVGEKVSGAWSKVAGWTKSKDASAEVPAGMTAVEQDLELGDMKVEATVPVGDADPSTFAKIGISLKSTAKAAKDKTVAAGAAVKGVAVLAIDQIIALCKKAKEAMDTQNRVKSMMDTLNGFWESVKNFKISDTKIGQFFRNLCSSIASIATRGYASVRSFFVKTTKAVLDYCSASLKKITGKGEGAAPVAAAA